MMAIIQELEHQAQVLEAEAKKLRDAASVMRKEYENGRLRVDFSNEYEGTRAEQLTQFLKDKKGATRNEIDSYSGIPRGTIAGLLGGSKRFKVDERGLWHPVEKMAS